MRWIIILILTITAININAMAKHEHLVPIIKKWEGGYAGNIDGKTCTHQGITLDTFRRFYGKDKNCIDLRNMTEEQWIHILRKGYWDKWKADSIENQSIANLVVDWYWHSGTYGITYPQQVLGVTPDGVVGPKTLAAINEHPQPNLLFIRLWSKRKQYLESIAKNPSKAKFLKGWMNRLNDFHYFE